MSDRRPIRSFVHPVVASALVGAGVMTATLAPTSVSAAPMTFTVTNLADAGAGSLRDAITQANANAGADTIEFADGLTGTLTITTSQYDITDSLTIVGPGSGEITIDADQLDRVFHTSTPGVDLDISGLTLTRGLPAAATSGGAIRFVDGDDLTLTDVVITDSAAIEGGAVAAIGATGAVTLDDAELTGNEATNGSGGAVLASSLDGLLQFRDSVVQGNSATDPGGANGGGIWSVGSSQFDLLDTTVSGNDTNGSGGGVHAISEFIQVARSTINGNTATNSRGGGYLESTVANVIVDKTTVEGNTAGLGYGGLQLENTVQQIFVGDSTFRNNTAGSIAAFGAEANAAKVTVARTLVEGNTNLSEGGTVLVRDSVSAQIEETTISESTGVVGTGLSLENVAIAIVERSTISDNEATATSGGGIYAFESAIRLLSSTVSGNSAATTGGALVLHSSAATISHSTIADNTAGTSGGGIAFAGVGSSADIDHSVLAGNSAPAGPTTAASVGLDRSLVDDPSGGIFTGGDNLVGVEADLGPLADNGGPTETHLPAPGSPIVDAGDPAIAAAPDTDQRGAERQAGVIDLGAVELQSTEVPLWIPVEPARLVDTRPGEETVDGLHAGGGKLAAESQIEFQGAGRAGVPDDAVALIVNTTVVEPEGPGYVTGHACLDERPVAAGLNYVPGVNIGNEVIVGLDDDGRMCAFVKARVHLVVDVVGYVPATSPYVPVDPARLLETRPEFDTVDGLFDSIGRPGAEQRVEVDVAGRAGVDPDAEAVVLYVAAVRAPANGFLTVFDDCDDERPTASSLNHVASVNRGNEIVAQLGDEGQVCVFTKQDIDVTIDVVGYVPGDTEYRGLDQPVRVLETRPGLDTIDGEFEGGGKLAAGSTTELDLVGRAGIEPGARTVIMNVTAVDTPANGYVIVYTCGDQPLASSLNYVTDVNGGNELITGLSPDGTVCIFTLREIHLTVDVSGFTKPDPDIPEPPAVH